MDFLYGNELFSVPSGDNKVIKKHVGRRQQPTLDEYKEYCSLIKEIHPQIWSDEDSKNVPYYFTEMLIFSLLNDVGFTACIPVNFKLF